MTDTTPRRLATFLTTVTALAVTAATVSGCSDSKPQLSSGPYGSTWKPTTPTAETAPSASDTPTPTPSPTDVAVSPTHAPQAEGETSVFTFGDVVVRATPNTLGVYTALDIPNRSKRQLSFDITLQVTGPGGYKALMKRSYVGILPGDDARDGGLLIDHNHATVPQHPAVRIVAFSQSYYQ